MPRLFSLILPEGLIVLAAVVLARFGASITGYAEVAEWLPVLVLLAGAGIAWRYRRGRTMTALVIMAVVWGWILAGMAWEFRPAVIYAAAATLIVAGVLPEQGFRGPYLWMLALALLGLAGWVGAISYGYPANVPPLSEGPLAWTGFPTIEGAALLVGVGVLLIRTAIRPDGLAQGCLWALIATWGALLIGDRAGALILVTGGAGAVVAGTLESIFSAAYRDALTGLPSRRALDERLAGLPVGAVVAMVDVDHFKQFNDTYGHDTGDQVLRMVAWRLAEVKDGDAYRYGGEEFTLIFTGMGVADAMARLEGARAAVAANRFTLRSSDRPKGKQGKEKRARDAKGHGLSVTVSIGAAVRSDGEHPLALLKRADEALYKAKEAGRDRVLAAK